VTQPGEIGHPYRWVVVVIGVLAWLVFNVAMAWSATHADPEQYDSGMLWLSLFLVDISTLGGAAMFLWDFERAEHNGGDAIGNRSEPRQCPAPFCEKQITGSSTCCLAHYKELPYSVRRTLPGSLDTAVRIWREQAGHHA
jgi:hypothetical protein